MVGLCLGIGWNRVRRHFHDGLAETISLFTLGNLIVSCVAYWDKGFRMFLMSKKKKKKGGYGACSILYSECEDAVFGPARSVCTIS